ncbi:MAG: hypothetical protein K5739_06245 [Lachnospiraceae bacterium]|nr:hypothetical protein [Lachnospiraceae bacterium]
MTAAGAKREAQKHTAKMTGGSRMRILFLVFLLLAGLCNMLTRTFHSIIDTTMFTMNATLILGLLFFWNHSLQIRLLPSEAKTYMLSASYLMIFYCLLRIFKYRMLYTDADGEVVTKLYVIPKLLIPTLFLMTTLYIRRGGQPKKKAEYFCFLPPTALLLAYLMTNLLNLQTGAGIVTYGSYIWVAASLLSGLFVLLRKIRMIRRREGYLVIACPVAWLTLLYFSEFLSSRELMRPYNDPEINAFCMLSAFEICMILHLIPHNENYREYFSALTLPICITDQNFETVLSSNAGMDITRQQMQKSLNWAVYPDPDTRLRGIPITGGYTFFEEDESSLHKLKQRLREDNEVLALENELLEQERQLKLEKLEMEERNILYEKIARAVRPAQEKIAGLLAGANPKDPSFRETICEVLFLSAFVKRRANLCIVSDHRKEMAVSELSSAIAESVYYLRYNKTKVSLSDRATGQISCEKALLLYDAFETVLESLREKVEELWVCLKEDGILMMTETQNDALIEDLSRMKTKGISKQIKAEDGQLTIHLLYTE